MSSSEDVWNKNNRVFIFVNYSHDTMGSYNSKGNVGAFIVDYLILFFSLPLLMFLFLLLSHGPNAFR